MSKKIAGFCRRKEQTLAQNEGGKVLTNMIVDAATVADRFLVLENSCTNRVPYVDPVQPDQTVSRSFFLTLAQGDERKEPTISPCFKQEPPLEPDLRGDCVEVAGGLNRAVTDAS